jgi:hypothetical protein
MKNVVFNFVDVNRRLCVSQHPVNRKINALYRGQPLSEKFVDRDLSTDGCGMYTHIIDASSRTRQRELGRNSATHRIKWVLSPLPVQGLLRTKDSKKNSMFLRNLKVHHILHRIPKLDSILSPFTTWRLDARSAELETGVTHLRMRDSICNSLRNSCREETSFGTLVHMGE